MYRRFFITSLLLIMLLSLTGLAAAQNSNPAVTAFSSTLKSVDRAALTNRTARIPVLWTSVNRPILANLVFEQVLPDNTTINVELPRLVPWVNSSGNGVAAPILPTGNVTEIKLRVRLINILNQATLDSKDITLPISQDGSGSSSGPSNVPAISSFSTSFTGKINRNELASGTARIPVLWTAVHRPLSATLVFDQVMPDGALVNVELPRSTPWVNSSDKGMVAPRLPAGTPTEIRLRLRLVDLVYGRVLDQRDMALPIDTGVVQPPTITSFASPRINVSLNELQNTARVPVSWDVANRPANSNLLFEQVMANNQVRNAELPREVAIVPSAGQGTVVLIENGSASEVVFRVRLIDLTSGTTLATREIKLPILNASTSYRVITGDACYKPPFPAAHAVTVGQTARILYFSNGATVPLYKDKAPAMETLAYLKANDTVNVIEGPYCIINGDQPPLWNFRQWKVTAGNQTGWVHEYSGNQQDGYVNYMAGGSITDIKPELVTFAAQPADKLAFDGDVTVTWEVKNATRIILNIGKTTLTDQPGKGSQTFKVKDIYNYNPLMFSIMAFDTQQNGVDKTITVPVDTQGTYINSFTVSPTSVQQGAPVTVTWDIVGSFASAYVTYDKFDNQVGVSEIDVKTNTGEGTITIGENVTNRTHTFTLWVVDSNGVSTGKDATVVVTCANAAFFVSDPTNQNGRCASAQSSIQAAYQPFGGGFMLWKKNPSGTSDIMAFYNTGTYAFFPDWDGTSYQITDTTPNVLLPANGFGYVWNANANVKTALGYPTSSEQGYTATHQSAIGYGKYETTFFYVTLPDGRTLRYASGANSGSAWGFVN